MRVAGDALLFQSEFWDCLMPKPFRFFSPFNTEVVCMQCLFVGLLRFQTPLKTKFKKKTIITKMKPNKQIKTINNLWPEKKLLYIRYKRKKKWLVWKFVLTTVWGHSLLLNDIFAHGSHLNYNPVRLDQNNCSRIRLVDYLIFSSPLLFSFFSSLFISSNQNRFKSFYNNFFEISG